jgi:acetyltransferase-like isoleucine patch superfamily enzyme
VSSPDRPIPAPLRRVRNIIRTLRRVRARLLLMGRGSLASDLAIGPRARWLAHSAVKIGPRVSIGADFFLETGLIVEADVLISSRVAFISDDHVFDGTPTVITKQPRRPASSVYLEGDNLIGHGTIVLGPARIGRGTIIGAGSLVLGDLPANAICVGRPARVVRMRRQKGDPDGKA